MRVCGCGTKWCEVAGCWCVYGAERCEMGVSGGGGVVQYGVAGGCVGLVQSGVK